MTPINRLCLKVRLPTSHTSLISELKFLLNTGVTLKLKQQVLNIRFVLGQILGDNLALNSILGFNECFVTLHFCRLCQSDKFECQNETDTRKFSLRTTENYERDLLKNDSTLTGIKKACVFSVLLNFNVPSNCSLDLMHDSLEGVCPFRHKINLL